MQANVATATPGDPGYNGGRWQVHGPQFANYAAAVAAYDTNGSGNSTATRRSPRLSPEVRQRTSE
jgi:hypothetical protein